MISETQMLAQIEAANQFIDKTYLETLHDYRVQPLDSHLKKKLKREEKFLY